MDLTALKQQLNITFDHDDVLLQRLLDVAIAHTKSLCGDRYYTGASGLVPVTPIQQATLMLAAHLYENRETSVYGTGTISTVPLGYYDFIAPYREWAF